jgi:hypothetical protein
MNNRKSLFFVLPLIVLVLMACRVGDVGINSRARITGSGTIASEQRDVSGIERVQLTSIGDLKIVQGQTEGLTVEADDNLLPYIETKVRGRELTVSLRDGYSYSNLSPIRYTLQVKNLDRVAVSGSGNITAEALETSKLSLVITGSSNVTIDNLMVDDLRVQSSGSGNFELAGSAKTQEIDITGSGNYRCGNLESANARVKISGAGNVTLWAEEELNIRITGFGNLDYYGSPSITQSISGGGSIKRLGDHN